jgi:hypothetical protein
MASLAPNPKIATRLSIRLSTIALLLVFSCFGFLLFAIADHLPTAHRDWTIQYFSSDAAVYFEQYEAYWKNVSFLDNPLVLLTGTPIVLMKLANGNLSWILAANLLIMLITLRVAFDCLEVRGPRLLFLIGTLVFPYFLFGFLSLNKEIYAMCAAIFFGSYWIQKNRAHLLISLLLAFSARYFMFVAFIFLLLVFPSRSKPRYWIAVGTLLFVSMVAPLVKTRIPGYSSEGVLQGAGFTSILFSKAVDSYAYALVYPLKYLSLVPARIYSVAIGLGRPADPMEAVVSLLTILLFAAAIYILTCKRTLSAAPRTFAWMAIVSPIPIMWTDVAHWRYFSYIYFFLLFSVTLYVSERITLRRRTPQI